MVLSKDSPVISLWPLKAYRLQSKSPLYVFGIYNQIQIFKFEFELKKINLKPHHKAISQFVMCLFNKIVKNS